MTTIWNGRTRPTDNIINIMFDDQFYLFDDINAPFDGIVGYSIKWTARQRP